MNEETRRLLERAAASIDSLLDFLGESDVTQMVGCMDAHQEACRVFDDIHIALGSPGAGQP